LKTFNQILDDCTKLKINTDLTIPWVNKSLNVMVSSTHGGEQLQRSHSTYVLDGHKKEDSQLIWRGDGYEKRMFDTPTALPEKRHITFTVGQLYVKEPVGKAQIYSERHQCFLQLKAVASHCYELTLPGNASNRYYYQGGKLVRIEATEGWFTLRFERKENHITGL